jgi:hypothetical protein
MNFVQAVHANEAANGVTIEKTITGTISGNGLIIQVRWPIALTLDSVTCAGETVAIDSNPTVTGSNNKHGYASIKQLASGGSKTIVATVSGVHGLSCDILVIEVSGQNTTTFFDKAASNNGGGANPSVSITTDFDDEFLVGALDTTGGSDTVEGSGFTGINIADVGFWSFAEYKADAGAAGAKTVDYVDDAATWFASAAAYRSTAEEVQLLGPIQDISAGTWLPSSGSPAELWQMIDGEESPDFDYDYTTSAGTMEVKLAPGSTPSLQTGHTLRYRLRGNGTCDALVKLKCGSTVISQWTEPNVPAVDTDYEHTLDSSPSFSIADYTDLRISVEAIP